jgi:serine/threonine-protein kinase ULK2
MFSLKIADIGFARHLQSTSLAEPFCGRPLYMAPAIKHIDDDDIDIDLSK